MITIDTMYNLHHVEIDLQIKNLSNEIKEQEKIRRISIKFFTDNASKITTCTLEEILEGKGKPMVEFQVFNKLYNIHLKNYNSYIHSYKAKLEAKEELEKSIIKESIFKYVLKRFNTLIMDEIIYNAYFFSAFPVGYFYINKQVTKKKTIDWGSSDRAKAEILEKGQIPYIKADAEQAEKEGKEYKGVPWIKYLPPIRFYIFWVNNEHKEIKSNNVRAFTFDPSRSKGGVVKRFFDYIRGKSIEELTLKYNRNAS